MYYGLKNKKGYACITDLPYSFVCGELQEILELGIICMYLLAEHFDHTHYFIQLKKGVSIEHPIFNNLFSESYVHAMSATNSNDFILYVNSHEGEH